MDKNTWWHVEACRSPACDVVCYAGTHNFEQFKLSSPSGGAGSPIAVGGAGATPRQSQSQHTGPGRLAQQPPASNTYQQGQHSTSNHPPPGQQPASWHPEDAAQQNSTRQWPGNHQQQAVGQNSMGAFNNKHAPQNQGNNKGNQDAGWGAAPAGSARVGSSGGGPVDASTPPIAAAGQGGVMRFARN